MSLVLYYEYYMYDVLLLLILILPTLFLLAELDDVISLYREEAGKFNAMVATANLNK